MEQEKIKESTFWTPTFMLRWEIRPITFDPINKQQVLQQMWNGDQGHQQWIDIKIDQNG